MVLGNQVGDLFVAADQRCTGTAAHQADSRPQVWINLQFVEAAAVQGRHAALPFGFGLRVIGNAAGEDPPKYNSGNGLGGSDTRASVTV
ncbi:Uncharacterised protein [Mycobacteroides abscessus subsp. abscessus]|nr:Uncharacterised protein [Mycobacteroides abscessus subsp. abscessus]